MLAEAKHSILYIDDEPDNITAFRAIFRRFYAVFSATSGEAALMWLRENPVDLIISDQRMPHMTGVEFFERVRDEFPDPVRIILTGYSDVATIVDAINKGKVYHYITKPWKMEEMKIILDNALESYALKIKANRLETERNALLLQAAQQEAAAARSRFEVLQTQVNPHFLFNCMNVLNSLIGSDPARAQEFTTQFCKVYRRVLEQEAAQLIPLRQELEFLESYVFLQKMRFEGALHIQIEVPDERSSQVLVPPFALQLLVENAIKHNIAAESLPLTVRVELAADGFLLVRNRLQPRNSPAVGTGIGLKNLTERYQLLTGKTPTFGPENGEFVARLPLVQPSKLVNPKSKIA